MTLSRSDQGQREVAALAVAAHSATAAREARVVEAAHADGVARLDGKDIARPLLELRLVAHPGSIKDTPCRCGQADHVSIAFEPVDVAVGDRKHGAETLRRRLQDLPELQTGAKLETGLEEQLLALLGALAVRGALRTCQVAILEHALEVVGKKAPLAARCALAGYPALGDPAAHRARADAEQVGRLMHAEPARGCRGAAHRLRVSEDGRQYLSNFTSSSSTRSHRSSGGSASVAVPCAAGFEAAHVSRTCEPRSRFFAAWVNTRCPTE